MRRQTIHVFVQYRRDDKIYVLQRRDDNNSPILIQTQHVVEADCRISNTKHVQTQRIGRENLTPSIHRFCVRRMTISPETKQAVQLS